MSVSVSVVVAVHNEEGATPQVVQELKSVFDAGVGAGNYELVFVDDKSTDKTPQVLEGLKASVPELRVIRHENNVGKSGGVFTGVLYARGDIVKIAEYNRHDVRATAEVYRKVRDTVLRYSKDWAQ
jgi:dolichol-phosphate mannosyltransferase